MTRRLWWPLVVLVAVAGYVYGIGNPEIPNIGDEAPYIQIARMTAESGGWLPLQGSAAVRNTKPPMLFWQGIVTTARGAQWDLAHLRLPLVGYTLLTALLVLLLARRITGDRDAGFIAALTFLCFLSTFQYGRPFVTNMPETFFVFLPFFLLIYFTAEGERPAAWLWLLAGLSLGVACLYKSFVLVVPVTAGLFAVRLAANEWSLANTLRRDGRWLFLVPIIGLACFALWPLLDPQPDAVLSRFVFAENVSKFSRGNYLAGMFTGGYTVFRIWLGDFANAGLMALPLAVVAWIAVRRRDTLSGRESALWLMVLSFIIIYTIPAQRQENYLIPTTPALAVLLGIAWDKLPRRAFHFFALPALLVAVGLVAIERSISSKVPGAYATWQQAVPVATVMLAVVVLAFSRIAVRAFHFLVILLLISASCILSVFSSTEGRYSAATLAAVKDQRVYVPSHFVASYEWYQFQLPGAQIESYDASDFARRDQLLESGEFVVVKQRRDAPLPAVALEELGTRLAMRSRHTPEEILEIALGRRVELLIDREVLLRRRQAGRSGAGS